MKRATFPATLRQVFGLALVLQFLPTIMFAASTFPDFSQLPSQPGAPDPLVRLNGERVATKKEWFGQRRPELKALFQHYMYGVMPPAPEHVSFKVERVDKNFFGGKATKKEVTISFDGAGGAPGIHLLLVIPHAHPKDPSSRAGFPVFVGPNFYGNHLLVTDTNVALPTSWMPAECPGCVDHHATDAGRGSQVDVWAIEQSIDRGYAVATFYYGDVEPDYANAPDGLRAHLARGSTPDQVNDTGAIAAWAWGISRAVDYLVTDKEIDARRIAVVGHSRNGKAAGLSRRRSMSGLRWQSRCKQAAAGPRPAAEKSANRCRPSTTVFRIGSLLSSRNSMSSRTASPSTRTA